MTLPPMSDLEHQLLLLIADLRAAAGRADRLARDGDAARGESGRRAADRLRAAETAVGQALFDLVPLEGATTDMEIAF